jgi:hypothetical protein
MSNTQTYPGSDLGTKGFVKKRIYRRSLSEHTYRVTKPAHQPWPAGSLLVNFCDGGLSNFDGYVNLGTNDAVVIVYID